MFTLAQSLNSRIFAKTMSDLEPRSENYHTFVETIFEKKINASCWFIARNGSCVPNVVSDLSTTKRVTREATTTKKPINLAKLAIMTGIKLLAPLKQKMVEKMYMSADTGNVTALQQFIMGTVTSNAMILSKIGNTFQTNVNIQKGTTNDLISRILEFPTLNSGGKSYFLLGLHVIYHKIAFSDFTCKSVQFLLQNVFFRF